MNNLIDRYKLCIPRRLLAMLLLGTALAFAGATTVSAQDTDGLSLITNTPEEGFALAVKLSQKGVATVQPDAEVRKGLRNSYAYDTDSLIAASQVIAIHFQTVAAANDYWEND